MAKEETPKDITPMKRRGIDMAVKGLRKTYPFIMGYEDDTTDQYQSSHYIDLIIDLQKLSDYMDVPVNPYWVNFASQPEYRKIYAIWSYLKFPKEDEVEYDKDISNHPGHILGKDVIYLLESIYEYIPEEYKLFYDFTSEFAPDKPMTLPVNLKINGYIMT
jgi:hypothetical protein